MKVSAKKEAAGGRAMKTPFYDLEPGDGSYYLCANGCPIARFDELTKAEAVRDALATAPCPTKSGSGDLSDDDKSSIKECCN